MGPATGSDSAVAQPVAIEGHLTAHLKTIKPAPEWHCGTLLSSLAGFGFCN